MKLNINGKEVDVAVNGEVQSFLAKKGKLSDKGMDADEVVRQKREEIKKQSEGQNGEQS